MWQFYVVLFWKDVPAAMNGETPHVDERVFLSLTEADRAYEAIHCNEKSGINHVELLKIKENSRPVYVKRKER